MSRASCPRHGEKHMEQDGQVRWCSDCAWEDPDNPEEVPPPADEEKHVEPAGIEIIGTKDLARLCKTRIGEIEAVLAAAERKFREQSAAARVELGRLRKIVAFCEGTTSAPSNPGAKSTMGMWTCPKCGFRTKGRAITQHKDECLVEQAA